MLRDIKSKLIVGLVLLAIGQALAIFSLANNMNGRLERVETTQQTILSAVMGQSPLPPGPIQE